jgi:hypothetical protein
MVPIQGREDMALSMGVVEYLNRLFDLEQHANTWAMGSRPMKFSPGIGMLGMTHFFLAITTR